MVRTSGWELPSLRKASQMMISMTFPPKQAGVFLCDASNGIINQKALHNGERNSVVEYDVAGQSMGGENAVPDVERLK